MSARPRVARLMVRMLLATAVAATGLWYAAMTRIERCADQGGRWDAGTLKCEAPSHVDTARPDL